MFGWKLLDVANGNQRVFINRVLVKEIADNPAPNLFEVRKDLPQQTDLMHRQQGVVNADAILHHFENGPAGPGVVRENAPCSIQPLPYRRLCHRMQARLLPVGLGKGLDHFEGIAKVGLDRNLAAAAADLFLPHRSPPGDLARPQEVVTHHGLRGFTVGRLAVTQAWRDLLLMLIGQHVEVSLGLEVQKRPHAMMEGQPALEIHFFGTFKCLSNPVRPMEVADPARRVLQVRLQLEHGLPELFIPNALRLEKPAKKDVAMTPEESRQDFTLELRGRPLVSREVPVIQNCCVGFDMCRIECLEVRPNPDLMPYSEGKIPQRIQSRFDNRFVNLVFEEEKQVQVRLRMQRPPAVTSNREKGKALGVQPVRLPPDLQ